MAEVLKGGPVAEAIRENIIEKTAACREKGAAVKIAIVRVGERGDDLAYEKRVLNNCGKLGIEAQVFAFPAEVEEKTFKAELETVNRDPSIHGILLFRPLPKSLNEDEIVRMIDPGKDIDCMNPENLNKVFHGETDGFYPCTPEAVIEILKYYEVELSGANAVVVNRSMVLGKPLAMMLMGENATVTICHSKTKEMERIIRNAEIVVTGVGRANHFNETYFSDKNVVIDVGINVVDGKMTGDVDFEAAEKVVKAITPVPGGVGAVTSMILLRHAVTAAERGIHG